MLVCMLHQNACDVVRFIDYSVTTVNFTCTSQHDFENQNMCQCAYNKIKTCSQDFFPAVQI